MWTTSMPVASLNFSPLMCVPLPAPADAKLIVPGFCFACVISSCTDLMPVEGATTRTFGWPPSGAMSTNALRVSNGRSGYNDGLTE